MNAQIPFPKELNMPDGGEPEELLIMGKREGDKLVIVSIEGIDTAMLAGEKSKEENEQEQVDEAAPFTGTMQKRMSQMS